MWSKTAITLIAALLVGCSATSTSDDEPLPQSWVHIDKTNTVSIVQGRERSDGLVYQPIALGTVIYKDAFYVYGVTVLHAVDLAPTHIVVYDDNGAAGYTEFRIVAQDETFDIAIFEVDIDYWPNSPPALTGEFVEDGGYVAITAIEKKYPFFVDVESWTLTDGRVNRFAARLEKDLIAGDSGAAVYDQKGRMYGMIRAHRFGEPDVALIVTGNRIKTLLEKALSGE